MSLKVEAQVRRVRTALDVAFGATKSSSVLWMPYIYWAIRETSQLPVPDQRLEGMRWQQEASLVLFNLMS